MSKVIAKSANGKMLKVGEDDKNSKWYYLANSVSSFLATHPIEIDEEIEFKDEQTNGSQTIVFLSKKGANINSGINVNNGTGSSGKSYYTRDPNEQASIKRQAIGHMVSRTIIGLQGMVDINNIGSVIDTLYAKYQEKVG